jgi:hypothetical protein
MWERWDSNKLHGHLTRAGQVVQATVAPLAPTTGIRTALEADDPLCLPPSAAAAEVDKQRSTSLSSVLTTQGHDTS